MRKKRGIPKFCSIFARKFADAVRHLQSRTDRNVKKLKHIINWTIWSLLALYVATLVLIHLPAVQHFLGDKVASAVADKLGTRADIGRIDMGFFNRLIIDDVTIYDQSDSIMLQAGRLSVKVDVLPLLEGRIAISSAQLFGVHANLYKTDSLAAPNYQFVLDSLSSTDTTSTSAIDLRINSLIVRHSSIRYDRLDQFLTPGRFNSNHVSVNDISAHIALKALTDDSLNLNIKRLAFHEQSGLNVDRFTMRLAANRQEALLEDFRLQLPHSTLCIDTLTAIYDADHLTETIRYSTSLTGTSIMPSDLKCLVPELNGFDHAMTIDAAISGTARSIDCRQLLVRSDNNKVNLQADISAEQQDSLPIWRARIRTLDLTGGIIAELKEGFDDIPVEATRLGDLHLTGEASGLGLNEIDSRSLLQTDAGRLSLAFTLTDGRQFKGHLETDSIHLGTITNNDELGHLTTQVDISGNSDHINATGQIARLDYKGYTYQNIDLDGTYEKGMMSGMLKVDDPNLQLDVEGRLSRQKQSAVRLTGFINRIVPKALGLSNQWGDASFAAVIDADFTASSLNDAEGSIDLDDFTMTPKDSLGTIYHIDNFHVKSGYDDEGRHFLKANGDMGEVSLSGAFDWETLPRSFINYTASKLPTLPGLPKTLHPTANNFTASLKLTDTEWMRQILGIPLSLDRPLLLDIEMNDNQHLLDIKGQMPAFAYDDSHYRNGSISLTTEDNTAKGRIMVSKLADDNTPLDIQLILQAADNQLATSLIWDNKGGAEKDMNGIINAVTEVYTNDHGKPEAHLRIQPSQVSLDHTHWRVDPCDILYTDKRLVVDHFSVAHGDQHLIIDGIASSSPTDSLVVDLNRMEVAYILDMVNFHSVSFAGLATGKAYITQPFDDVQAWADLVVEQFLFQEGRMGTLHARAEWNKDDKQIDIAAVSDDGPDTQTVINGYVSPARNDIYLDIRALGTSVEFCNSFTNSFLSNVNGKANGQVLLSGLLSRIYLTGELVVDGQATVKALNTTYTLHGDTVRFVPDEVEFHNCAITDRDGHRGNLNGALHHRSFSRFTFDIDVEADNLLAYDFPSFDNGIICGIVYATGRADLHGRPGEVTINCNVTPSRNSFFAYNAANPDAISQQEFITWGTAQHSPISTPILQDQHQQVVSSTQASSTDIRINFDINATPEATLRVLMDQNTEDYITLNGTGNIKATFYNKGPFHMFGTYTVDRGTYGITIQNIIKKNFTFQDGGTIVFGGDPFDANLNLQAVYTVNGVSLSDLNLGNSFSNNTVRVNCLMNIGGTPGAPRVEFDLEMPNVNSEEQQMIRSVIASEQEMNQQVLYLLGIGRFYTQGANNAQSQQYDQTSLAMQSFLSGAVSTQINEVLSQVIKSNDWNFGANISTGNEGWHNAEYEGIVSGRMLNNRLLINGQFGYRDNATQANPSFIGDFDIRYLLTPSGNLALKVYNQTNDRYFTRSSLNTQGMGLIMKKDFNGVGDLFRFRKRKSK